MSIALVISMYAIWSSIFSLGKILLQQSPPLFLTGFRMVLGGALLLLYLLLFNRSALRIDKKQLISLIPLAFFSIYITNTLEFWGLQYLSAAKACFIYSLSPFFAALFSYLHFREKMNRQKWLGLGIGFLGILPVLAQETGSEKLVHAFALFSWPALALIGATLAAVYGWVLLRLIVKDQVTSPLMANGTSMLIGGLLALGHSLIVENWAPLPIEPGHFPSFFKGVLVIIFISNLLCYNLYGMLLRRFTATFLSFVGLLSPIFASLNSWFFLGEIPSWTIFLSTAIVSIGLWIVYRAELKQGYLLQPSPAPSK
jgi:drug/metabolite transporter (DMT)-like permease